MVPSVSGMKSADGPAVPASISLDVGLAIALAVLLAGTAYLISDSWGGTYWQFGCVAGAVVSVLALSRRLHRAGTAAAGLVVGAAAVLIAQSTDLPREPGPAMTVALAALVGSAVRTLPAPWAAAVPVGGLAIVAGAWAVSEFSLVAAFNAAGWLAAVTAGLYLRLLDGRRFRTDMRRRPGAA